MSYKTLQEKAKAKGKLLLIESVSYIPKTEDIIILSSKDNKFTEAKSGKQYEARGILKNVPITRYTENANSRIYSRPLWENVQKSGLFEGSDSLANHADDDGNVLDQVGVWHNLQIGEEVATADLYCIGAAGNLLLEKIKAGGKTGFSTVGFGELSESGPNAGKEVDPTSYEYSNTDWVMKPSQAVYATQENLGENTIVKKENKISESEITNNKENKKVEVKQTMDKYLELSIKNQIKSTIKEAIANENCVEAIRELKEVSESIIPEMAEQKAQVDAVIVQIQTKLEEQKNTARQELKESKETLESLSQKYEAACETIKGLKENLSKASIIVEKVNSKEAVKAVKIMEKDIEQFAKDRELMEADITKLAEIKKIAEENIAAMNSDLKAYEEDTELREKDIAKFKEERASMKFKIVKKSKELKEAEKHIKKLEKTLSEEFGYDFDDDVIGDEDDMFLDDSMEDEYIFEADEEVKDDEKEDDAEEAKKESKKSKSKLKKKEAEEDEKEDDEELEEDEDSDEDDDDDEEIEESDEDEDDDDDEEIEESEDSDEDDDDDEEIEESEDSDEDEMEEAEDEESDDDKMAALRAKKESIRHKKNLQKRKESKAPSKEVIEYYKAAVKAKPAVKDIQKQVLASKSLLEAVKKVAMFESKFGNDIHKLKESNKAKNEVVKYVFKI